MREFLAARTRAAAESGLPPEEAGSECPWDRYSRRFLARIESTGLLVGVVGVTLPGADFYEFEDHLAFPHDAIPTQDRNELAEGQALFIDPAFRHTGLGLVLAFMAPLVAREHGARWLVMENDKSVPAMLPEGVWRDTGVIVDTRGKRPFYLFVGATDDVLRAFGPPFDNLTHTGRIELAPDVAALADAWRATR